MISFVGWEWSGHSAFGWKFRGNRLGNCRWSLSLTFSSEPEPSTCYLWDQNGSVLTAVLFEIYQKLLLQDKLEFGDYKKMSSLTLNFMQFTQFCRTLLSIVAGIFISSAMDLHLGPSGKSGIGCPDSWTLPDFFLGYILFDLSWCIYWVLYCCCTPE